MTVLPVPIIPTLTRRYTGVDAPANLVILSKRPIAGFGPEASMGVNMPPDKISPYSGIYDENGKLPTIPTVGTTFIAKV